AVDALALAVLTDRLRDREHVRLVERATERRTAVTTGAKTDPLRRVGDVRAARVVLAAKLVDVDQDFRRRRFAGERMDPRRAAGLRLLFRGHGWNPYRDSAVETRVLIMSDFIGNERK